jgi:predicted translin family RNA/ssDNA-binding protein
VALREEAVDSQELLCLYLQFNRVTALHKIIELNRKLMAKLDVQKLVRFGQICGFLRRIHEKIMYAHFPQPLIVADALKRLLQERGSVPEERALREES